LQSSRAPARVFIDSWQASGRNEPKEAFWTDPSNQPNPTPIGVRVKVVELPLSKFTVQLEPVFPLLFVYATNAYVLYY
jgi:hypothetical protein